MKKSAANLLTLVGVLWTGLAGFFLLGVIVNLLGGDNGGDETITRSLSILTALLIVGIVFLFVGLRLMRRRP